MVVETSPGDDASDTNSDTFLSSSSWSGWMRLRSYTALKIKRVMAECEELRLTLQLKKWSKGTFLTFL